MAEALEISAGDTVMHVERVLLADGQRIGLESTYLPKVGSRGSLDLRPLHVAVCADTVLSSARPSSASRRSCRRRARPRCRVDHRHADAAAGLRRGRSRWFVPCTAATASLRDSLRNTGRVPSRIPSRSAPGCANPKQIVTPVTVPFIRAAERLTWRRNPEDVEVLTLASGVGIRLFRPAGRDGSGSRAVVDPRRRVRHREGGTGRRRLPPLCARTRRDGRVCRLPAGA